MGAGGGGAAQRDPGWKPRGAPRPGGGAAASPRASPGCQRLRQKQQSSRGFSEAAVRVASSASPSSPRQWLPNSCARSSLGRPARARAPCARGSPRTLASSISPAATSCGRTSRPTRVVKAGFYFDLQESCHPPSTYTRPSPVYQIAPGIFSCGGHGFEPWSRKIPHAVEQLNPYTTTTERACHSY
nr:adenylate kinase 4, mitochondrial isoform X8 [Kogia breviceps]